MGFYTPPMFHWGEHTRVLCLEHPSGQMMAHWRNKASLYKALAETMDGRSTNGLRRAVRRMLGKKETIGKGTILNTYLQQVQLAQSMGPSMQTCTDDHLSKALQAMEKEAVHEKQKPHLYDLRPSID